MRLKRDRVERPWERRAFAVCAAAAFAGFGCSQLASILPFLGGTYSPTTNTISSSKTDMVASAHSGPVVVNQGDGNVSITTTSIGPVVVNINNTPQPPAKAPEQEPEREEGQAPSKADGGEPYAGGPTSSQGHPTSRAGKCVPGAGRGMPCNRYVDVELEEGQMHSADRFHFSYGFVEGRLRMDLFSSDCTQKRSESLMDGQKVKWRFSDSDAYSIEPMSLSCGQEKCTTVFRISRHCL